MDPHNDLDTLRGMIGTYGLDKLQQMVVMANETIVHPYAAYVENIGGVGKYATLPEAIVAVTDTIASSGRAGNHGYVIDADDEIVYETGERGEE